MKTLLIPTDFSVAAENALVYAFELNKIINAKIILFHSYFIPIPATDIPISALDDKEIRNESMNKLRDLKKKMLDLFPGYPFDIDLQVSEGVTPDEIARMAKKENTGLIVMGTKGAHGLHQFLMGTNAADVILQADCPVLAIPENAGFSKPGKIVFATNFDDRELFHIEETIRFAKQFGAEVILLHVSTGDYSKEVGFHSIGYFLNRLKEDSGYSRISFKLLEDKHVEEAIRVYLENIHADILAISNRHRSFFRKTFDPSLTKKLAYHTQIPLLAFHESEK